MNRLLLLLPKNRCVDGGGYSCSGCHNRYYYQQQQQRRRFTPTTTTKTTTRIVSSTQPQRQYYTILTTKMIHPLVGVTNIASNFSTTTTTDDASQQQQPSSSSIHVRVTKNTTTTSLSSSLSLQKMDDSTDSRSTTTTTTTAIATTTRDTPPHPLMGDARQIAIQKLNNISPGSPYQWEDDPSGRNAIVKVYYFINFQQAFSFMEHIAVIAEQIQHHPEWTNIYNMIQVTLSTHDCNGISSLDIELAQHMDTYFHQLLPQKEKTVT